MLFTALSYGRMASLYPVAGSAYTYVGKELGPQLGFLSGWLIQLDYFFLPMVAWLIGAAYLSAQFPGVPTPVWILAFILILIFVFKFDVFSANFWGGVGMPETTLFEQVRATMLVTVFVFLGIEGASVYSRYAKERA